MTQTYRVRPRTKYGNRKVQADGYTFDSVKEYNHYVDLKYRMLAGEIKDLELQKPYVLQPGFRDKHGKWHREIKYIADFVYYDNEKEETIIEDVKSKATAENGVYKMKRKMMLYNGLEITEIL